MIAVDTPTLFHPQCLSCKRADEKRGPYVDYLRDFDHDHQGRIYHCRVCLETAAKTLGLLSGDEDDVRAENERLQHRVEQLEVEVEKLRQVEENARWSLEHFGGKLQKKPGRPRKKTPEKTPA